MRIITVIPNTFFKDVVCGAEHTLNSLLPRAHTNNIPTLQKDYYNFIRSCRRYIYDCFNGPTRKPRKIISPGQSDADESSEEDQEDWAIQFLSIPEDGGYLFAQQVLKNKGQRAGDGSCKEGRATGGFLSFEENDIRGGIRGATEVPLTEDDSTPYRGELGGI